MVLEAAATEATPIPAPQPGPTAEKSAAAGVEATPLSSPVDDVSVQDEAERIFKEVLLKDGSLQLPANTAQFAGATTIDRTTTKRPVVPCPSKMTETSTALWALAATLGNLICNARYGLVQEVSVNSEVATLFLLSSAIVSVGGKTLQEPSIAKRYMRYDLGNSCETYRRLATNIYPTKDGKWFHLHGSMDATPTLTMLNLPLSRPELDEQSATHEFCSVVRGWDSRTLDQTANEQYRQAGTICYTPQEFKESEQGRAIAAHSLYLLKKLPSPAPKPIAWPAPGPNSTRRPLEGIKILDVSRVIAAPTIAKLCALFGATVIRISCLSNPDMGPLLVDGNLGKHDVTLDLKSGSGKSTLRRLIKDADVFLDGYRPGAMDRLGFSPSDVQRLSEKGIVYVRENCYGWAGPLSHRSGWQQISDCMTGVSYLMGRFLKLSDREPVVPLLPNSDYQTGLSGLIGIMAALVARNQHGGSQLLDVSLNYYNQFLLAQGEHSTATQDYLREHYAGTPVMGLRHYDDMPRLVGKTLISLKQRSPQIFKKEYFMSMPARLGGNAGEVMTFVGPAIAYSGETKLKYDVGSCFLGVDQPEWPADE
jgi:crotonobetainyl-CoA:carnitine CoA-transferase CaiB-like acyl-CoA transferase